MPCGSEEQQCPSGQHGRPHQPVIGPVDQQQPMMGERQGSVGGHEPAGHAGRDPAGQRPEPRGGNGHRGRGAKQRGQGVNPGAGDGRPPAQRRRELGGDDEGGQGVERPDVTSGEAGEVADGDQRPDPGGHHGGQPRAEHGPSRQPVAVRHHQPDPQVPPEPVRAQAAVLGRAGRGRVAGGVLFAGERPRLLDPRPNKQPSPDDRQRREPEPSGPAHADHASDSHQRSDRRGRAGRDGATASRGHSGTGRVRIAEDPASRQTPLLRRPASMPVWSRRPPG